MTTRRPPPRAAGPVARPAAAIPAHTASPVRHIIGAVCLVASLVVVAIGFALLVRALDGGQYGTAHIAWALVALGAGGGLMGVGFALLIWEYSVRHGVRH